MITSAHFNRQKKYRIQTIILSKEARVIKKGLTPEANEYLKDVYKRINNLQTNKNLPFLIPHHSLKNNQLISQYIQGKSFLFLIEEALFNHNFSLASRYLAKLVKIIDHLPDLKRKAKTPVKLHYTSLRLIDLTADNFILTPENKIYLIDLEWWSNQPLSKEYLIWRLLTFISIRLKHFLRLYPGEKKVISLNTYLPSQWLKFLPNYFSLFPYFAKLENRFQQEINLVQAGYISPRIPHRDNMFYRLKEKLFTIIRRKTGC